MSHAANGNLRHYLDNLRTAHDACEQTDGQLLERFVASRDEAAFAALLRRHGPLVLRVCRSVLGKEQDAEDAFQATFLVLTLRAASVRKGLSLGSWLYGVARRTALAAERRARRRRKYEQRVPPPTPVPTADAAAEELRQILDEETRRLPEKYRLPFLLCCLEGKSRQRAADDLGWPEGTVSSRLAEARRQLQERLGRRGYALSAALAAAAVPVAVPAALAQSAARSALALAAGNGTAVSSAVLALTRGVSHAMLLSKIKATAALTLLLGVCAGAGLSLQPGRGAGGSAKGAPVPAQPSAEDVRAAAGRIEEAMRGQRWGDVQTHTERLLAGNRALATRVLGVLLRNNKLEGRTYLLATVARKKFTAAVPLLVELLGNPDKGMRVWSIDALAALGQRSAVAPLEKQLKAERDRGVRFRIRVALARLGRPYLRYFLDGLADRDPDRRRWCLVALGELGDPRAVPAVMKLLGAARFWDSVAAATCLKQLTGVNDATVTGVVRHPDGSVQTSGKLRPVQDVRKDCEAWIVHHRKAVYRPIEKSPESWAATPQPLLPGLKVSFTMTAAQVVAVNRQAGIACKHSQERRWQNGGASFLDPETVTAERSLLVPLNVGLVDLRYVFEHGRLSEVRVTRTGRDKEVVAPLVKPLRLRRGQDRLWIGLGGAIVVSPSVGDAEKQTVVIRLNLGK